MRLSALRLYRNTCMISCICGIVFSMIFRLVKVNCNQEGDTERTLAGISGKSYDIM